MPLTILELLGMCKMVYSSHAPEMTYVSRGLLNRTVEKKSFHVQFHVIVSIIQQPNSFTTTVLHAGFLSAPKDLLHETVTEWLWMSALPLFAADKPNELGR